MPRTPLVRTSSFAYHVTARANNKEWFYVPPETAWRIFRAQLAESADKYGVRLHAFVLMANHYHLVLSTPEANLDRFMRHFMTECCRRFQIATGRINHIFGGRYRWSVLESAYGLAYVLKYVFRNPVRAGLCGRVEDYPHSSLSPTCSLPISEGFDSYWRLIPKDWTRRLLWLNSPAAREIEEVIQRALRRRHFRLTSQGDWQSRVRTLRASYGVGDADVQ